MQEQRSDDCLTLRELREVANDRIRRDWEELLRRETKYGVDPTVEWEKVRELYYQIRNEYLLVDLSEVEEY